MRGITVGIDIGTTNVTTVVTRREKDGKIRVLGVGVAPSRGLRKGAIVDIEETALALRRSLHDANRASGVAIRSAVVGINGSHIGTFTTRGVIAVSRADGEITEEDVNRVVHAAEGFVARSPNREIIHLIPREFKVDGQGGVLDPIGMIGMKLEVEALVVDAAKPALQNIVKCCEAVGVEIESWAASALAAAEVLLSKEQKELGAMLLDLGAGTTDFAIFEEGRVLDVGSFPIGGSHITSDIAIGLRTPVSIAEAIKIRHASVIEIERTGKRETIQLSTFGGNERETFQTRDLVDIISARLTDIFELTSKAMRRVGRAGLLPGGIVLTGGVSDIPGIQDLARQELKLPIEVAKAISLDMMEDVVPPRLAIPVGLVLWQRGYHGVQTGRGNEGWRLMLEPIKRVLRAFIP